ncbi:hypothetical protein BJ878DRAFT_583715 [Calycina marina]|uniref:mRNA N(6)-methyladenine demethylase n=1 Tax=Calycina marina TaxID=1763456 RepID=A0A9P8CET7_9HELO|nr:hypothetical protein BJ878DRAFT_583715 [Calycina marina]
MLAKRPATPPAPRRLTHKLGTSYVSFGAPYRARHRAGLSHDMDEPKKRHNHDTHAMPPQAICNAYKKYQQMDEGNLLSDPEIVDFGRGLSDAQKEKLLPVGIVSSEMIASAQEAFMAHDDDCNTESQPASPEPCTIYEHRDFPGKSTVLEIDIKLLTSITGLRVFPSLLPPECQVMFVDRLMHRELSNPLHMTNIHHDYNIPFPQPDSDGERPSFFKYPQSGKHQSLTPLNPHSNHKPLNMAQFLQKKLRWLTIGDQYNWQTRSYPMVSPTLFPKDISALVTSLFENSFTPESGVVLLYSAKDYMPVHRDVSEECERGLASFSLGCDGLFIIAHDKYPDEDEGNDEREQEMVVIRVRSGDVVQMAGPTRFSWHAMPRIIAGTYPQWLENWPVNSKNGPREYERWRGYMKGKRLNISCRQVWT